MISQIKIEVNGGCVPTDPQILLLKAALLSGDEAIIAWEKWSEVVNLDRLDWGEVKLLPLLYHNLKQNGIAESQIPGVFKGMYRRTWAENKLRFHCAGNILSHFVAAEIPIIVLKGAVIASHYYQDYGLRPMADFDFLVPTDRAQESIEILYQNNWQPKLAVSTDYFKTRKFDSDYTYISHGRGFLNPDKQQIDFHWHVLHNSLAFNADLDFWEGARSIEIAGIQALMLDPADQLLHVCVHGARWCGTIPIRWVADSMIILQKYPDLDWQRLIQQTIKNRLMLPMQTTLEFLVTHLAAPIPSEVLVELGRIESTSQEKYYYQYLKLGMMVSPTRSLHQKINYVLYQLGNYHRYRHELAPNTPVPLIAQLQAAPNFFHQYLGLDSKWQIPKAVTTKILRHILT
jgi:hypothetical protein